MALNVKNLEGNENADDYVRTASGEQGRWAEAWTVFKSSFGKIILINLLVLIFCAPAIALLIYRTLFIAGIWGPEFPFNSNTGIGYPAYPDSAGLAESLFLRADLVFYSVLIGAGFIASIGIAGGAYSIKKLLNTHGKFTFKGFFHGVKVCYFKTVLPVTIFFVFYFAAVIIGDWKDLVIAQGGAKGGPITAYVFIIIATVLVGLYCAWLISVGVGYKIKLGQVFKNAFIMLIGSPVQTIFFAGFALIPVWLYMIGTAVTFIFYVALTVFVFIGFSFILLVWTAYTQWIFDAYVQPEIQTEKAAKKSVKEVANQQEEDETDVARVLLAAGRSELIGKPILPISEKIAIAPLGKTFKRSDLNRISSDRQQLGVEVSAYENEHKNDPVYAEYNKLFAEREKALPASGGKKNKKKKVSAENLLR